MSRRAVPCVLLLGAFLAPPLARAEKLSIDAWIAPGDQACTSTVTALNRITTEARIADASGLFQPVALSLLGRRRGEGGLTSAGSATLFAVDPFRAPAPARVDLDRDGEGEKFFPGPFRACATNPAVNKIPVRVVLSVESE